MFVVIPGALLKTAFLTQTKEIRVAFRVYHFTIIIPLTRLLVH